MQGTATRQALDDDAPGWADAAGPGNAPQAGRPGLSGLLGMIGIGLLLLLWSAHAIGSGAILLGFGLLAAAGYGGDRAGRAALAAPAGVLLGLGGGLALCDLAGGSALGWAGAACAFGLGLLGVYWAERQHAWALLAGGPLLLGGLLLAALTSPTGAGVAGAVALAALGLGLRRAIRPHTATPAASR